jgi:hypothetical protein
MKIKNFEKGQAIVIIALSLIGLVAMAALIIDGSNAYLNRRRAQTAADAAAMAGARELCLERGSEADVYDVALEYATVQNNASAISDFFIDEGIITVTVDLTADTFFAKVFNKPTQTVVATASAGCYNPASGKGILPVAWACKNIEGLHDWQSPDCKYKALHYEDELKPLLESGHSVETACCSWVDTPFDFEKYYLPELYVIMDTQSLPDGAEGICFPDGVMDCDFNNDGKDDFLGKGDASWLDLNGGGGGSSELVDWVHNGFLEGSIRIHTWIPSQPGDDVNIFHAAADHVGEIVMLPIFNQFCVGNPFEEVDEEGEKYCLEAAHEFFSLEDLPHISEDILVEGTANTYYHIMGFGYFFISCVDAPAEQNCPGHDLAVENGLIPKQINTIEGYFVTHVPTDFGSAAGAGGVDLGVYIISLTN